MIYIFIKSILPPPCPPPISPPLTAMIYLGYQRVKLFKSEAVKITISQLWSFAYRKFSGGSPRKMEKGYHPDSDLSVIHYMGLFCPRKKLVKVKKFYFQNILKYAPLKSDRGVSSSVIIWIRIIENLQMKVIFSRKRMLYLVGMSIFHFK